MDRAVVKYYLFEATRNAHLSGPVWVLFLLSRGISYSGIGLLDAAFSVTILLAELPTGYVGDRIGRRRALLIGTAGGAVGSIAFAFGRSLPTLLVVYVLLAVSQTFSSGSDSAWLYETLETRLDGDEFARVRGRGRALGLATGGVAALAGGVLGSVNLAWPWLASGLVTAIAVPVVATFPEPTGETGDDQTQLGAFRSAREQLFGPDLRWFVLYTGVFAAVMGVVNFFVQPVTRDAVAGLSVAGYSPDGVVVIGAVYAAFSLVSAAVTANAGRVRAVVGTARWFRLVPPALGALLAGVALAPAAAVPLFFVLRAVRSLTEPLQGQYLNDRIPSLGRATTLSAVAMAHSLIVAPFEIAGGRLADALGTIETISVLGVGLLLVGVAWVAAHSDFS